MRPPREGPPSNLATGDVLDVTVEKGVYRGLGLARNEGRVVFVPRGLPGDGLRVRVDSTSRGFVRAAIEEVRHPGPDRRASPCPYVPRCGGCVYQELSYSGQLRLKQDILRESLGRSGVAWAGAIPVHASPEEGWRMRCSFHLEEEAAGSVRLGLREQGSHRVVDLPRCLQLSAGMNRALRGLKEAIERRPALARRIHDVELAESLDGTGLVASLESSLTAPEAAGLASLGDAVPWLTGLGAVVGEAGRRLFLPLRGDPHVEATVQGLSLRSHVRSFFQANRFLTEPLVAGVVEATPAGGTVLDLYAGVGLFALPLASRGDAVRGVEINPTAVDDATANARRAGLTNVRVERGDVLAALGAWPVSPEERIVLDPPRTGAGPRVVKAVAARRPSVVTYVSCDPPTLGRDLKLFAAEGYRLDSLSVFDLFPDTFHLESVARLVPA